jgi:glycosyltransferase involved in cell wall biosynthesis
VVQSKEALVIISQPVHQQAYETVVAAQEAGLLHSFRNGLYRTGRGLSDPALLRLLPAGPRAAIERAQRRRWHREIDAAKVSTLSRYHLVALAARPILAIAGYRGWNRERFPWDIDRWAHERFDAAVGRSLDRTVGGARIVHAWEGAALATFGAARKQGLITILDVAGAFEYSARAIAEEGGASPPGELLRRVRRERELAEFLFVPSEFVKSCLVENGVPERSIVKIPYGVDLTTFAPLETSSERPFTVLFAGRIGLRKGVTYLLEAWSRLRLPNSELVLIGSPDKHGSQLLRRHEGQYRHIPQVPLFELHRWFQSSDLFVFPSLAEGSALVTYMALGAGLPMVTTVNSGSVLRDGVEGFLVPPRNVDALADRIRVLHEDPALRQRMGAAARATVLGSYTWAHYRSRIGSAYRAILDGRDPRASLEPPVPT